MKLIARHKFLFDIGTTITSQFMGLFNTALLIVVAGDKIRARTGMSAGLFLAVGIVGYVVATWAIGYVMDRIGYIEHLTAQHNLRNAAMRKIEGS